MPLSEPLPARRPSGWRLRVSFSRSPLRAPGRPASCPALLHHNEVDAILAGDIVDRDDARVIQR